MEEKPSQSSLFGTLVSPRPDWVGNHYRGELQGLVQAGKVGQHSGQLLFSAWILRLTD